MSASLEYDFRAIGRAEQIFRDLAAAGEDTKPLAEEIGAALVTSVDMRFEREEAPDGTPWKKTNRGGSILQDSGDLRGSITYNANKNSVRVGSNKIYARVHQLGAVIKPKNGKYLAFKIGGNFVLTEQVTIPARPYLGVNADDREEISAIAADFFNDVMGGR